ncbi:MAG TPA: ABC transporter ATP-binding protein [Chthoniobacteraceae bacterium]|jgi:ATP-binding cassette subfamily B protein/subfamily B ATP-binding cassette protein MsbA|nr:ABC transporter ATP-binding protein [Chthoniobacteraceae bacterium]
MSVYRRALLYFRPFLPETIWGGVLMLAGIAFNLIKPWPFGIIVNEVLAPNKAQPVHALLVRWAGPVSPAGMILGLCAVIVTVNFLAALLNMVTNMIFVRIGLQSLLKLRTDLYACLQALPLKYHDTRRSTDSSFRVAYDSQAIQSIYSKGTFIFSSVITLVSTLVLMFRMDWELTLVALAIMPLVVLAIFHFAQRIRSESTTIQERESDVLAVAQEGLSSIRMVHAFGREDYEVAQFRVRAAHSLEASLRFTGTQMKSSVVIGTLMALGTAAMYYLGSIHVLHSQLSLGALTVLSSYLIMLYQPLEALTYTTWALEGAAAGAQRCFEVLDHEDDVRDAPDAREITGTHGGIVFEKVDFGYDDTRLILEDINLRIEPGQTVAFVGGTGAGKSTLLSLAPRFYDPTRGRVLLDGHDLRAITKKSLRRHISIVLQDTLLFSTTIRENIAYGRPDATEEEIVEAAKRAQAHDFILRMADGYSAQVGERGGHLSVGQRQRIGIARAFLKDAPILLLDEPTSALDATTEAAIMETIKELMRGRTTLLITHRIATIHDMGQIVVLKHGKIAETGPGPELVSRGGAYAELYYSANLGTPPAKVP